jgi:Lipase maturation factor
MGDWALLDPLTVWGLFYRGIGLVYVVSFLSLAGQVLPYAGERGAQPVRRVLERITRDFPGPRRFLYFPTLLWVDSSDRMLRALTWLGALSGAVVLVGGPLAPAALASCYLCQLSLDLAMALIFPWDCLLFECTLLGLFLPATRALPEIGIAALPAPAIAWAYRLLLFRVMFGFGKQKFVGSRKQDLAYLRGFLVNQPLPSKLAWYAQKLPLPLLQAAVWFMFVVEVPTPFLALWPGLPSVVCAALTAALMLGIQAMGTFGYFSLITGLLCLPLLDTATPLAFSLSGAFAEPALAGATLFVALHTLGALAALPFNSWLGQSWHTWAYWYQLPRAVQPILELLRLLHPFRWLHPYGVFPPNNTPAVKMVPVFEVSWDEKTWHELEFRYSVSHARSAPRFIAPHHPRGDQALIYDTFGLNATSLMNGVLGIWSPYPHASRAPLSYFCQSVLRGDDQSFLVGDVLQSQPKPPALVRVTTHMLEPLSLEQHARTGAWWRRRYVGPHRPAEALDPELWADSSAEPELWHFEAISWRRRSRLGPLLERAATGRSSADELVLMQAEGLQPRHLTRFWNELVPLASGAARESFDSLPDAIRQLHERFDRAERRALERVLARYALFLVARFEPLFLHRGHAPLLNVPTYFHLWLLAHHIIGCGPEAYQRAYADPASAAEHIPQLTPQTGLYGMALFRHDALRFEAQKLRLIESFTYPHDQAAKRAQAERVRARRFDDLPAGERFAFNVAFRVSGYFHVLSALRDAFQGVRFEAEHPEQYPRFSEAASGEIRLEDAAQPSPSAESPPLDIRAEELPRTTRSQPPSASAPA